MNFTLTKVTHTDIVGISNSIEYAVHNATN